MPIISGVVVVGDVPTILAQMRGDAVGAGGDRHLGRLDRIGMMPAARITHGRDMIDIDAEADGQSWRHRYSLRHRCTTLSG